MKKCKYCDHRGYTERGEEVCTKYLLYIGEDKVELPCKGFEMTMDSKKIILSAIIALAGIILLISLL